MNGSVNGSGTAHNSPTSRLDETEGGGAERPVGKVGVLYAKVKFLVTNLLYSFLFKKTGELYNPKSVRQPPVNANGGGPNGHNHQRTPSDKVKDVISMKNGDVAANANNLSHRTGTNLVVALSTMSLGENGVEPSSSISTFRVGLEQEPTVATTSST